MNDHAQKPKSRIITKSPTELAKIAHEAAQKTLPIYSSQKSRKDYTQAQIFAILVLKAFFKTDYRGIIQLLKELSDLRKVLELNKIPHSSTLCYAEERLLKKGPSSVHAFAAPETNCIDQSSILNVVYKTHYALSGGIGRCDGVFSQDQTSGELQFVCVTGAGRNYDELKFEPGRVTGKWHIGEEWGFIDLYFGNDCAEIIGVNTGMGGAGSWFSQKTK